MTSLLTVRPDRDSVWGQYTIFADDRDHVQRSLRAAGIPTAVHYPAPLHHQVAFEAYGGEGDLGRSVAAARRVLSLPMSADLDAHDQARIARALDDATRERAGNAP